MIKRLNERRFPLLDSIGQFYDGDSHEQRHQQTCKATSKGHYGRRRAVRVLDDQLRRVPGRRAVALAAREADVPAVPAVPDSGLRPRAR